MFRRGKMQGNSPFPKQAISRHANTHPAQRITGNPQSTKRWRVNWQRLREGKPVNLMNASTHAIVHTNVCRVEEIASLDASSVSADRHKLQEDIHLFLLFVVRDCPLHRIMLISEGTE